MDVSQSPDPGLGSDAARDAVSQIVEKADERQREKEELQAAQKEKGPHKPFLARPAVAVTLMAVFVGILALDVYLLTRPTEPATQAELESAARMETAVVALQIEAYQQANGRYPSSLADAEVHLPGVEYTRTANGYVLQAKETPGVSLRSDQNPEDLVREAPDVGGAR